jgi:hypothetical protein
MRQEAVAEVCVKYFDPQEPAMVMWQNALGNDAATHPQLCKLL